ncbi:hypothetical protein IWW36_005217 [Coemansia brasiliensis]|uniref:Propanoyl-CoA:carbon dioxide ligase subunit alpha n=1 Tax=Coemansia brasiliensis TaxID=2650707 RepID=A0A9W8I863_9FUNG|nr:hypothetical protein IWW36_005217 [Coemansia brasiliensis]
MYYDPMICKLSTHGPTRADAIATMSHALDRYLIKGVTHNIPLLRDVIGNADFGAGHITTAFLAEHYPQGFKGHRLTAETATQLASVSAALQFIRQARESSDKAAARKAIVVLPQLKDDGSVHKLEAHVSIDLESAAVNLQGANSFTASVEFAGNEYPPRTLSQMEVAWDIDMPFVEVRHTAKDSLPLTLQFLDPLPLGLRVQFMGTKFDVDVLSPRQHELMQFMKEKEQLDTSKMVLSPMPGTIVSVAVKPGDSVSEGMQVAVVEAMKMQNVLRAPQAGTVKAVHVCKGATVGGDDILIELE